MSGMGADRGHERSKGKQKRRSSAQGAVHDNLHSSQGSKAAGADLAAFVPIVEPVVRRALAKRRLSPTAIDDVVQEVWVRGLRYGVECETARECYRWATVVAQRIATDHLRKQARWAGEPVPDAAVSDPAEYVESRLALGHLRRAFPRLSARDRGLILHAQSGARRGGTKRERDRYALRLMRARERLRAMMDGMAVIVVGLRLRVRDDRATVWSAAGMIGVSVVALSASHLPAGFMGNERVSSTRAGGSPSEVGAVALPDRALFVASHAAHTRTDESGGVPTEERRGRRASPPVDVPWNVEHQQVELKPPPRQLWVEVGTQERQPDDHMLCLRNIPVLGSSCYDAPEP